MRAIAIVVASTLSAGCGGCGKPAMIGQSIAEVGSVVEMVAPYLPENPVILEGGAYDGENTLRLAAAYPRGTVHAFEPVPALFAAVKTRAAGNANVRVYELALSDKSGKATFHVSEEATRPNVPSQSGSLLAPREHTARAPSVVFKKTITVATTTIDDWAAANGVDHVDLLYLDIQGAELAAMKGAPRIMKTVKAIKAEVEFVEAYAGQARFREVSDWLEGQGFRMVGANFDPRQASRPDWVPTGETNWFGDVVFVRR